MACATISLDNTETDPVVTVLGPLKNGPNAGQCFISLELAPGHKVYLPGYDADCATYARDLAAQLIAGAERIETLLAEKAEQPINQKVSA